MKKILVIIAVTFALTIAFSYAAVPHLINYQGKLTDSSGAPLNNTYNIIFRIYDSENAGILLWQGTYNNVQVNKGVFNALLGDVSDTGYDFQKLSFDKPYWLEIKVGEDEPMKPRQRITSAGYAISADSLTMPAQQGDILYYNGTAWSKLPAGEKGQYLQTQGTNANPQWKPFEIPNYLAGDLIEQQANKEIQIAHHDGYHKYKEIQISRGGTLRISFDLKARWNFLAYGKIYRNGLPVGRERSTQNTFYTTFTEDIAGWNAGDLVQIYCYNSGGGDEYIANFKIKVNNPTTTVVNID